ncbi:MAG: universal stress protein [Vicinamibacterales bacterium]
MTTPQTVHVRQILFASDFSAVSDHAFAAALALAQHFEARLHLLHVVRHAFEQEAASIELARFAREQTTAVPFVTTTAVGDPVTQIVAYAEREQVAFIVMGTHGRTGLRHVVCGSVAEGVVRHAPCLVLTVRGAAELPLEAAGSAVSAPQQPATGITKGCLLCARPSDEVVCAICRARIEAEAFSQGVHGGRHSGHAGRR